MSTNWSLFFGRFHPLLVHIPVGIILFAALLQIIAVYRKNTFLSTAINIALLAGAISATIAALSGLLLSSPGGYNVQTVFWHKWIGISAALLSFLVWWLKKKRKKDIRVFGIFLSNWLLSICIILIALGGHLGGKMTHGDGYLTKYMPAFLKSVLGSNNPVVQKKALPLLDSIVVFSDIIQPIFNEKCISCHNADKTEGELDLTSMANIIKGGKSGKTIFAGDTEKSELFHRVTLAPTSSKFMPADNQPPLTALEINFIRWWIQTGADYTKNVKAAGVDEKTKYLFAAYLGIDDENDKEIILPFVQQADTTVLNQLKELKLIVRPLTSKSNLLEVSFVMVQNETPAEITGILQKLSGIKQQVYRLDISNCHLALDALKIVAGFSSLHQLEIQKSNLTDELIGPVTVLQQLAILNAGQNALTDKSIPLLKKMSGLKKINLWQTQVTEAGSKDLQAQLPGIAVER